MLWRQNKLYLALRVLYLCHWKLKVVISNKCSHSNIWAFTFSNILNERPTYMKHTRKQTGSYFICIDCVLLDCLYRFLFYLYRLRSVGLPLSVLTKVYESLILSVMVYGCPIWAGVSDNQIKKLSSLGFLDKCTIREFRKMECVDHPLHSLVPRRLSSERLSRFYVSAHKKLAVLNTTFIPFAINLNNKHLIV